MITEGWTQITCESSQFEQHVAANQADPKYINCTNTTAYRYYGFKFADNYGYASYMGVRRIELQAAPFLPDYSEPIIKQEGSSSLKGVAAITTSLNQTLTRTVAPALNLSGRDTINFDIRASRTGSNIKIGIHDSGGNTTEITPNIAQADTWQTVSWDISGVGNFSKDAIDQIIVTVVNADAANTFYIDNMHAPSNSATGDIVFTTSNAERIRIDENGYVGIGTATPANALDIGNGGGIHIASGTPGSTNMALYNNAGTLTWNGVALATGGSSISGTANYIPIFTGVATLGNSAIYQTGGNVGIGTTAPGNKLSISGGVGIGTTAPGSRFLSTKAPDGGLIVEGNVGIGTTSPRALLDVNGSTWLRGAVGGTSGLYVNSAGNVGIGTTNPSYKLDLAGDINITGSYRVNGTALAAGMGGSGTANYLPIFATGTTLGNSAIYQTSGNLGIGTTLPSQLFQINNSGSTAFVVTSGGNVGIGTTNPGAALEINGQVKITGGVPGANKILTSDINGLATWETAAASGATIALDNLANVAINTSLLPSGNNGIDLGDNTHRWRDLYLGPASLHIGTSTSDEGTISYATSNNVLNFQSTGNLAFQSTGGNVGIGTTAPTNLLDVAGGMKIGAGYAGIGTTAPTNGLLIQGNVGIGTTNPGAALDVNGAIRTTSISNTGGTNGMGMFLSADKAVDLMEYADDAAAQAAYAGVETPSYASSGGTGDRTATITATTDLTTFGNVSTLLDGALSNVHYWNNAQDVTGKYVKFQFASPKLITEATWYQDAQVQGTWKWQGSNDNSNWTDIGSSFTLNNGVLTQLSGNTTAYLYYRMLGVSGTTSSSPWMREIEFKIADASVEAYSEPTIKQEGSFSLKGVAAITTSLNKTRTRTVAPALNLSGRDTINFDIRAARTGSNIKIGFHDSGGNTTEITPNIAQADTWQTVSWDISGVGNANKDAIDQIIVTVVNADAANTFYVDNMHAPSNSTTGDIAFTTSNAESMRIDEYGSVGIGTATPNYKLDVATDIASNYSANFFNDGNNVNRYGIRVQSGADNCSTTGTCQILDYFDGDGTAAGGLRIVTGTVGVYQPSDRRLKTDIAGTVKVGLDIINGLRVVDFRRTSGGSTGPMQTGFIAQEAQGVFPEMVAPTPDGYLAISEGMLIPVLTKAIQEQQGMIIQQQAQNTLQETAISDVNLKTSQNVETVGQLQKSVDDNLTVISSNFSAVDTKLALHDSAMANVNAQFTALDTKVSNIDVQIADLASKYTALNTGMSLSETEKTDLENRLAAAEASLVENQHDLITFEKGTNDTLSSMLDTEDMLTNRVLDHEDRLKALEDQVATMTVAAGGEIPANVVTQDALGNVTLAGVFRAKEVETQGIVAGDVSIKNQDTDSPTIGKAILKSGETEIIILTKAVTENSRILVTPEVATSQPLAATQKIAGESFKVEVEIPASKDIEFSWLIIEEKK